MVAGKDSPSKDKDKKKDSSEKNMEQTQKAPYSEETVTLQVTAKSAESIGSIINIARQLR